MGTGDVMCPWQWEEDNATLPRSGHWRVLQDCRLAVLDVGFTQRVAAYPEVISSLFTRALQRARHIAVNMAIVQQPRIDVRLHMLFWEMADRWGVVRQDGVHVPIHLTHATLADLVAARRPTVTKALGELAERSAVMWTGEDWLLAGDPPAELEEVGSVAVPSGNGRAAAPRGGRGRATAA
jgi:CRP-like cAMP-binding protein